MQKATEKHGERLERPPGGSSLAFLMDSYSSEATRKRERSVVVSVVTSSDEGFSIRILLLSIYQCLVQNGS